MFPLFIYVVIGFIVAHIVVEIDRKKSADPEYKLHDFMYIVMVWAFWPGFVILWGIIWLSGALG